MWYLSVFVPASQASAATAVAAAVWPTSAHPEGNLSVSLRDAGGLPWIGGNAAVTDREIAALQGLAAISGIRYYRYGTSGDRALGTASPPGPTEGAPWGWEQSLAASGLTLAEPLAG